MMADTSDGPSLPRYVPAQVACYQGDLLMTHDVCRFDPERALAALQPDREVLAIDIGGDKIRVATCRLGNGGMARRNERVHRAAGGAGYLAFLEIIAAEAIEKDLNVGISTATKMNGSVIARTVNLPVFFNELSARYSANYERLFPGRSFVANDTVMGICGAATRLAMCGQGARDVAFFVCGSGLGASVIADGVATHVEAAHMPLDPALNPLGQTRACGVEGREFVCLDRVVAGRAGIEDIYRQRTGEARDGVALGALYAAGDPLATVLYETSALALAHAISGVTERYGFGDDSAVVLHGGMFELARYREAVGRALAGVPHAGFQVVYSRDLSDNACLDGAAMMAVSPSTALA